MTNEYSVPIILGIDPGYDRVGWCVGAAVGNQLKILEYGAIVTDRAQTIFQRYTSLTEQLEKVLEQFHPQEAALESVFFTKNQKTALRVSEARGVLLASLLRFQVECFEYTPTQVKQGVTGHGQAEKSALDRMLRLQYHLENAKILDDVMDAIGVAVTHVASRQMTEHVVERAK